MVLIHFLKKAWTIVHGFNRFFEKSMDYNSWFDGFLGKKAWTIVHGFDRFFEKKHGL